MTSFGTVLNKHQRIMLQFSGGKDSLATLYLLEKWWEKILVVFCNAGDEFPETLEVVDKIKAIPEVNFLEVSPVLPQPLSIQQHGYPSDIIPLRNVNEYAYLSQRSMNGVAIQSIMSCCNRLLFKPLHDAAIEYGATLIIRGQRLDEDLHSPLRSGDVVDGIEYFMPLEDWTEQDVFDYLETENIEIPKHYDYVGHSLDCATCTGFLDQSKDKILYLKKYHPELYERVKNRLTLINEALEGERKHLIDAINI